MSELNLLSTDPALLMKEKISALQEALLSQHPTMPSLLQEIHKTLKANPDVVTLLEEEEIGVIVNGLKTITKTEIAITSIKTAGKKSIKNMSLDDI